MFKSFSILSKKDSSKGNGKSAAGKAEPSKPAKSKALSGGEAVTKKSSSAASSAVAAPDSQTSATPAAPAAAASKASSARSWTRCKVPLSKSILAGVAALGFSDMTPVQAATIPAFLTSKDVCVQAVTGSGKTLAFVIPIYEMLLRREAPWTRHEVGALVISPTRELAQQIAKVFHHFTPHLPAAAPLRVAQCIGGHDTDRDAEQLRDVGANIIVGTPGRLVQVLESVTFLSVKPLEVLVLDEADRLLALGFQVSLNAILARLPKQRRTGLFSATLTEEVEQLAKAGLRNPVRVTVKVQYKQPASAALAAAAAAPAAAAAAAAGDSASEMTDGAGAGATSSLLPGVALGHQATPSTLSNYYAIVQPGLKLHLLAAFLLAHRKEKVIVFFLTCAAVDYLHRVLASFAPLRRAFQPYSSSQDLAALERADMQPLLAAMHGQMPQSRRERVLAAYRAARSGVLLCTDVAARGVDIPQVDWILQLDAPQNPDYFVHRVGRAARAGRSGSSLLLLSKAEESFVEYLKLKAVPMMSLPEADLPPVSEALAQALREPAQETLGPVRQVSDRKKEKRERKAAAAAATASAAASSAALAAAVSAGASDGGEREEDEEPVGVDGKGAQEQKGTIGRKRKAEDDVDVDDDEDDDDGDDEDDVDAEVDESGEDGSDDGGDEDADADDEEGEGQGEESKAGADGGAERSNSNGSSGRYIRDRSVTLADSATDIVHHARFMASQDRAVFLLGANAFVSHMRAYKEHQLKYIFPFGALPFGEVALGYGLLYLPQLPDLKRYRVSFPVITHLHPSDIPFLDPLREQHRAQEEAAKRKRNEEEKRLRLKREAERAKLSKAKEKIREKKRKTRQARTYEEFEAEWRELAEETKAMRKARKSKSGRRGGKQGGGGDSSDDDY